MRRVLPDELKDIHKKQKEETIDKVQSAIDELKEEGYKVSVKLLVERTGLSRQTLSKPHVEAVLKENRVCKFEKIRRVNKSEEKVKEDLELEIYNLKKKMSKLELENKELENKLNAVKVELYEEKETNKKLLGELFTVNQKARMNGVRLELIKD